MAMPRPKWTPTTEDQRRAIAALQDAVKHRDQADELVWEAARTARGLGVPATFIGDVTNRGRTTVHRHIPPRTNDSTS